MSAIFALFRGTSRLTAQISPNKDKCRKCGRTGHFARNSISVESAGDSGDFPPLGSSAQAAEPGGSNASSVSNGSVDSQFLKDNELDLVQSQSVLRDLDPAGSSVEEGPISKTAKRARKEKGSSAKSSNFAPNCTVNICFTNSQEFNSLVANSDQLSITSKGNNESTAVHNISKDSSNEQSSEVIIIIIIHSKYFPDSDWLKAHV